MRRAVTVPLLAAMLVGCSPQERVDLSNDAARTLVTRVAIAEYPDLDAERVATCVLASASPVEFRALASQAVVGPTASAVASVDAILRRSETQICLAANSDA